MKNAGKPFHIFPSVMVNFHIRERPGCSCAPMWPDSCSSLGLPLGSPALALHGWVLRDLSPGAKNRRPKSTLKRAGLWLQDIDKCSTLMRVVYTNSAKSKNDEKWWKFCSFFEHDKTCQGNRNCETKVWKIWKVVRVEQLERWPERCPQNKQRKRQSSPFFSGATSPPETVAVDSNMVVLRLNGLLASPNH